MVSGNLRMKIPKIALHRHNNLDQEERSRMAALNGCYNPSRVKETVAI